MKYGAIILAAGRSSRMGEFKPLMPIGGKPMILHLIDTFAKVGCNPIVIVTGRNANELKNFVDSYVDNVKFVHNLAYESTQMLDSIKLGIGGFEKDSNCDKFFLTPADIPLFKENTLKKLLLTQGKIIKPSYKDKCGHPILLDKSLIQSIMKFDKEGGLKQALILTKEEVVRVPVEDKGILMDADTKEEYEKLLRLYQEEYKG